MKQLFKVMMSLLVLLALFSCKKQKSEPAPTLEGSWELRRTEGGYRMANAPRFDNFNPGNGSTLKFIGNTYEVYESGKLRDRGTFEMEAQTPTVSYPDANFVIKFKGSDRTQRFDGLQMSISLSSNKLKLYIGVVVMDGTIDTYEKI